MSCEGDKRAGYNTSEPCYAIEACPGCEKCIIKCEGCDNCAPLEQYQTLRQPEVGDYIVIKSSLILDPNWKGKWVPAMDMAIGRVGWVRSGNPVDGFHIRFTTTKKDMLSDFVFPQGSLRLAIPQDNKVDQMIKTTKEGSVNEDI